MSFCTHQGKFSPACFNNPEYQHDRCRTKTEYESYPNSVCSHDFGCHPCRARQDESNRKPDDPVGDKGNNADGSRIPETTQYACTHDLETIRQLVDNPQQEQH